MQIFVVLPPYHRVAPVNPAREQTHSLIACGCTTERRQAEQSEVRRFE